MHPTTWSEVSQPHRPTSEEGAYEKRLAFVSLHRWPVHSRWGGNNSRFAAQAKPCMRTLYLFCLTRISADCFGPLPSHCGDHGQPKGLPKRAASSLRPYTVQKPPPMVFEIQPPPPWPCFTDTANTSIAETEERKAQTVRRMSGQG